MNSLGNYSEYMSIVNDNTSCVEVEGESLYYSMSETLRNCTQLDKSQDGNVTLKDDDATQIGDITFHPAELPVSELEINPNVFLTSSTPNKFNTSSVNNKSVDGFVEISKILKNITTKLHAAQNKENVNTNINITGTSKLPETKLITKKVISSKPTIIITAPEVRNNTKSNDEINKKSKVVPTTSNQNRMSLKNGAKIEKKSFIPSKLEIKEKCKESPNKKLLPTQKIVRKEYSLRKSIIPRSNKTVTSALKVSTKPRPSISNSQKVIKLRRSLEKLDVLPNEKIKIPEGPKSITGYNRKTLNFRRSTEKSSGATNHASSTTSASNPSTTTSNNRNTLNLRRSIARFQGKNIKESTIFECIKCNRKFRMESNYLTHMNSHTDSSAINLICKYCDKKFQLGSALQTHLLDNCTKIPSKEKRLLANTNIHVTPASKHNSKTNSLDSLSKLSNYSSNSVASDSSLMKPPGLLLDDLFKEMDKKLKTLHSGVSRTPKKVNMCKKCGKMFYNIFTLQAHTTCAESDEDDE